PWARTIRLQQLHQLFLLLYVFSNLGNLVFAQSEPQWHEKIGFWHTFCTGDAPAFALVTRLKIHHQSARGTPTERRASRELCGFRASLSIASRTTGRILRLGGTIQRRPGSQRIHVVSPMDDLSLLNRDHRNEPVVIGCAARKNLAVHFVFQNHDATIPRVVHKSASPE